MRSYNRLSAPAIVAAFLTFSTARAATTPQVSLPGQTMTISGNVRQDSPTGPVTVTASAAGLSSVTFNLTATPNPLLPNITRVVNGASFLPEIVAGSWVTIQGANLSATTRPWSASDFINGTPPTTPSPLRSPSK